MKLFRFFVIMVFTLITFIFIYSLIPTIVWIFTGSFRAVATSPEYGAPMSIITGIVLAFVLSETIDGKTFRFKA